MELSVRDWMIIVGILLIVVVLVDGFRRVRNERRGKIRMSLNKNFLNTGSDPGEQSSELPNGGARTIDPRDEYVDDFSLEQVSFSSGEPQLGDENIDLNQTVPILMESVEQVPEQNTETGTSDDSLSEQLSQRLSQQQDNVLEEVVEDLDEMPSRRQEEEQNTVMEKGAERNDQSSDSQSPGDQSQNNQFPDNQEVFVINVAAKSEPFKGPDLLHILLACDLRFGEMDIFHRHEKANGTGAVQFSMANSVQPGIFDLDDIDNFSTPSVSFFMSVPGADDPMQAFDYMVETAQCLVKNLDGEMRDESRSVMTLQTLEHCRQRIRDFERRQLTQNA